MKKRKSYEEEANKLAKAIDLAIEAFAVKCPIEFEKNHQDQVIASYSEWKSQCLTPKPQFKNLAALKHSIQDVFTYFQESTGPTVEYFWNRIQKENLGYERVNKLEKILKKGSIKSRIEFDYVTDMILVTEQVGLTNKIETEKLSLMLGNYESKMNK